MTDIMTGGVVKRETEFIETQPGAPGSRIFATCGPDALASVVSAARNAWYSCLTVYRAMRNAGGLCDPNGASTLGTLHAACDLWGLTHIAFHDYDQNWATWRADVVAQAKAGNPFVLMLHAGQAAVDLISGLGENGNNIQNHFIAGLGYHAGGASDRAGGRVLPEGLWCADGASWAGGNSNANGFNAANVLQFYSLDILQKAWPVGFVVVKGYGVKEQPMAWVKQADGSGKDALGHVCGAGTYSALVTAGFAAFDGRLSETHYSASGVTDAAFLPLVNGAVFHAVEHPAGVWNVDQNGSQVAVDLYELLSAANAEIALLKKNPPGPQPAPPVPPVSDPLAEAALAEVKALKALFARLP